MANESNMFNPSKFADLLRLVIGSRSIQDFCKDSGLSRAFVSKAINCSCSQPTKRSLFRILSADVKSTVTLNQLLDAAGYEPMEELPYITPQVKRKKTKLQPNSLVIISDNIEAICKKLTIASELEDKYPVVILAKHLDTCVSLKQIIKSYNIDIQIALLLG